MQYTFEIILTFYLLFCSRFYSSKDVLELLRETTVVEELNILWLLSILLLLLLLGLLAC